MLEKLLAASGVIAGFMIRATRLIDPESMQESFHSCSSPRQTLQRVSSESHAWANGRGGWNIDTVTQGAVTAFGQALKRDFRICLAEPEQAVPRSTGRVQGRVRPLDKASQPPKTGRASPPAEAGGWKEKTSRVIGSQRFDVPGRTAEGWGRWDHVTRLAVQPHYAFVASDLGWLSA